VAGLFEGEHLYLHDRVFPGEAEPEARATGWAVGQVIAIFHTRTFLGGYTIS